MAEACAAAAQRGDDATLAVHEAEIDQIVYRLFDLTPDEIALIESALTPTRTAKTKPAKAKLNRKSGGYAAGLTHAGHRGAGGGGPDKAQPAHPDGLGTSHRSTLTTSSWFPAMPHSLPKRALIQQAGKQSRM